jgi:hypothetical protein
MNTPFYRIEQGRNDRVRIISGLGLPQAPEGSIISCTDGLAVSVPVPPIFNIKIDCPSPDEGPRHFIENAYMVIISELFLQTLRGAGVDNFEVFPAVLKEPELDLTFEKYYIFNEVGLVDAAKLEACKYDTIMGGNENIFPVLGFKEIVFSANKVEDKKIFRIPQFSGHLFFSDDVMDYFRKHSPPEKWGITTTEIDVI